MPVNGFSGAMLFKHKDIWQDENNFSIEGEEQSSHFTITFVK